MNWHWKGEELRYLLSDCGARVVFAHPEFAPVIASVLPPGVRLVSELEPWLVSAQTTVLSG